MDPGTPLEEQQPQAVSQGQEAIQPQVNTFSNTHFVILLFVCFKMSTKKDN